jgi:hypothetical protein
MRPEKVIRVEDGMLVGTKVVRRQSQDGKPTDDGGNRW